MDGIKFLQELFFQCDHGCIASSFNIWFCDFD